MKMVCPYPFEKMEEDKQKAADKPGKAKRLTDVPENPASRV